MNSPTLGVLAQELGKLELRTAELKSVFVDTLSAGLMPTPQDINFVKAFCVLFHAALEDFFEQLAKNMLVSSVTAYNRASFINADDLVDISGTDGLLRLNDKIKKQMQTYMMLVAYAVFSSKEGKPTKSFKEMEEELDKIHKHSGDITDGLIGKIKSVSELTKKVLDDSNGILQTDLKDNHGTSLKHLTKILLPVGIDVAHTGANNNENLKIMGSLKKIAGYRGDYAHLNQNTQLNTYPSKTDLEDIITDCTDLCRKITCLADSRFG